MSLFIYIIGIRLYYLGVYIASFVNPKAKLWIKGRKQVYANFDKAKTTYWFHCASLGEFEQARPLIEKIKAEQSAVQILLTFFSPSGYEVRKNYNQADYVCYLPLDTKANAIQFVNHFKPNKVFFIKYEFWYFFLKALKNQNIPTYLVSGIFRKQQVFFKWYGNLFRAMLNQFEHLFVQDANSKALLSSIHILNSTVAPDTRFARVIQIANNKKNIPSVKQFKGQSKLLIAGSTWPRDENVLAHWFKLVAQKNIKLLIVPHDVNKKRLKELSAQFSDACFFSNYKPENQHKQIMILDAMGLLSSVYQYADVAYIGGGFNSSVHNILEAAIYGIPLFFGPNHIKAKEALDLIALKGAFEVKTFNQLPVDFETNELIKAKSINEDYVNERKNGVEIIYRYIFAERKRH